MAEDISNKTLAVLVGLAIVISLAGIIFAPKGAVITGRASDTGTAQLVNYGQIAINIIDGGIDFGTGTLNESVASDNPCSLDSDSGDASAECLGTDWISAEDVITVNNVGTFDVDINVSWSGAEDNICGYDSEASGDSDANCSNWFRINTDDTDCDASSELASDWTVLSATTERFCGNLTPTSVLDYVMMVNITDKNLPSDTYNGTLSFSGIQSQFQ